MSRVRENRMHGSTRRREETGTSRASTSRTEPGASRRPDHQISRRLALARSRKAGTTDIVSECGKEAVERVRELTDGFGAHSVLECVGTEWSTEPAPGLGPRTRVRPASRAPPPVHRTLGW